MRLKRLRTGLNAYPRKWGTKVQAILGRSHSLQTTLIVRGPMPNGPGGGDLAGGKQIKTRPEFAFKLRLIKRREPLLQCTSNGCVLLSGYDH